MKKDIERFVERAKKDFTSWRKRPSDGDQSMTFNVFVKEEDGIQVAHCLELDIVATADSVKKVKRDITSLIIAQIDYAFNNDNLENLFHPAPQEVWEEFFSTREKTIMEKHRTKSSFKEAMPSIPPWIITNTLQVPLCHA